MGPTMAHWFPSQVASRAESVPFDDAIMLELAIDMLYLLQEGKKWPLQSNHITNSMGMRYVETKRQNKTKNKGLTQTFQNSLSQAPEKWNAGAHFTNVV